MRAARGDIIAFTDDDCIADENWLKNLVKWYKYPIVGGVGGRVIPVENDAKWIPKRRRLDIVGRVLWNGSVISNFDLRKGPSFVDCLSGANMSFRKSILIRAGYFSPAYRGNAYRFETDLTLRVRKLGYRIVFDPNAIVYHRRATNGGARVDVYKWNYWFSRNHSLFLLKYLDKGFLRVPIFVAKQIARILLRLRACSYGKPKTGI